MCDKACDECDYEELWCPIVMYGVCKICGEPIKQIPDLAKCLKNKFQDKLRKDKHLAELLYASLCNQEYVHKKTGWFYSCTWRSAGRIIAEIRDVGEDYIDFYCSGGENCVFKKPYKLIKKCGWRLKPYTLTEKIDQRNEAKKMRKDLKARIKKNEDHPKAIELFKFLLEAL